MISHARSEYKDFMAASVIDRRQPRFVAPVGLSGCLDPAAGDVDAGLAHPHVEHPFVADIDQTRDVATAPFGKDARGLLRSNAGAVARDDRDDGFGRALSRARGHLVIIVDDYRPVKFERSREVFASDARYPAVSRGGVVWKMRFLALSTWASISDAAATGFFARSAAQMARCSALESDIRSRVTNALRRNR